MWIIYKVREFFVRFKKPILVVLGILASLGVIFIVIYNIPVKNIKITGTISVPDGFSATDESFSVIWGGKGVAADSKKLSSTTIDATIQSVNLFHFADLSVSYIMVSKGSNNIYPGVIKVRKFFWGKKTFDLGDIAVASPAYDINYKTNILNGNNQSINPVQEYVDTAVFNLKVGDKVSFGTDISSKIAEKTNLNVQYSPIDSMEKADDNKYIIKQQGIIYVFEILSTENNQKIGSVKTIIINATK